MNFEHHIEDIREGLRAGRFGSEAAVSQGIVLRVLGAIGWPTWNTLIVCPEFSVAGKRVDFALCHPSRKPKVFIEVKNVGQGDGGERQLFEYAFHTGVPMVVLTDGRDWSFFLPAEEGDYGERRVYKLDILDRETSECVSRFTRYLDFERVCSGAALTAARDDYKDVARSRQIHDALPKAWFDLVDGEDEQLIDLLATTVENTCGFKPDPDTVARFLRDHLLGSTGTPPLRKHAQPQQPLATSGVASLDGTGFAIREKVTPCRSGREVLVKVVEALASADPTFLDRFAALPRHGRRRRYVARTRQELYPDRPDLAEEFSFALPGGYWLGINMSHRAIERVLTMACEVAGLRYGIDLRINLG